MSWFLYTWFNAFEFWVFVCNAEELKNLWNEDVRFFSISWHSLSTLKFDVSLTLLAVLVMMLKAENRSLCWLGSWLRYDEPSDETELLSLSSETVLLFDCWTRLIDSDATTEMSACTDVIWVSWDDDTKRQELHVKKSCSVVEFESHAVLDSSFK